MREEVFQEIGFINPKYKNEMTLTVRGYASIFRILFNSSYLNLDESEFILDLLSRSDYKEGIVAGLPSDIVVAHKFGERNIEDSKTNQLHDCGIIYYPNNPYILCIMTFSSNWDDLTKTISQLSEMIYFIIDSKFNR